MFEESHRSCRAVVSYGAETHT